MEQSVHSPVANVLETLWDQLRDNLKGKTVNKFKLHLKQLQKSFSLQDFS